MVTGVVVAVISTLFYNAGFVLEKSALDRLPAIRARRVSHLASTLVSSRRWLAGFACLAVGLVLQVIALSRAPISVVQPIFASGVVLLLLLAHFRLGEHLSGLEWAAVACVVVSIVAVGASLDTANDIVGTRVTLARILAAMIPTAAIAVAIFIATARLPRRAAVLYGLASGLLYGCAGLATKQISTQISAHGFAAAIPRVIASPEPYLFVAFCAVGLIAFQTGLQRCPASLLVPVSNVVSAAYVVAVGTPLFGEHLPADPALLALRLAGFVGIIAGLAALTRSRGHEAAVPTQGAAWAPLPAVAEAEA